MEGYRADSNPIALLQRWFSLVREKRLQRQEFLKSLVKVFQENSDYQSSQVSRFIPAAEYKYRPKRQDDVDFMRYMAENFATFDYKTQEEVITVIKHLTTALSTTGMQLLEMISPSHLLSQLHAPLQPQPTPDSASQPNPYTVRFSPTACSICADSFTEYNDRRAASGASNRSTGPSPRR